MTRHFSPQEQQPKPLDRPFVQIPTLIDSTPVVTLQPQISSNQSSITSSIEPPKRYTFAPPQRRPDDLFYRDLHTIGEGGYRFLQAEPLDNMDIDTGPVLITAPRSSQSLLERSESSDPPPKLVDSYPGYIWQRTYDKNRKKIAAKILDHIENGLHGCSSESHNYHDHKHEEAVGTNGHFPLSATYLPSDLTFPDNVGLEANTFPTNPQGLSRKSYPSAEILDEIMSGSTGRGATRHICLHTESPAETRPTVTTDGDSTIAISSTLEVFRKTLHICPTPSFTRNNTQESHIHKIVQFGDPKQKLETSNAPFHKIPHFYLGDTGGFRGSDVYIGLPLWYTPGASFQSLTTEQTANIQDRILWPSFEKHMHTHNLAHMPSGYHMSQLQSKAKSAETRTGVGANIFSKNISFAVQPHLFRDIWTTIIRLWRQLYPLPSTVDCSLTDPFVFIVVKGHKSEVCNKFTDDPRVAFQIYNEMLADMLDFQFIHPSEIYHDIAIEIGQGGQPGERDDHGVFPEPQVYLPKRCCTTAHLSWLSDNTNDAGSPTFYAIHFLYDASNATFAPNLGSNLYKAGMTYCQSYGVEKEIHAALQVQPFQNDCLCELCLNGKVWHVENSREKWIGKRDLSKIIDGFLKSKTRVCASCLASLRKSYPARFEYRINGFLYLELLRQLDERPPFLCGFNNLPASLYSVSTQSWTTFIRGNTHKFCALIDGIILTSPVEGIRSEQSRVLYALFKCLQSFFGANHLDRHSTIWYGTRSYPNGNNVRGLGFELTLEEYGYCWWLPIMNWSKFSFLPDVAPLIYINKEDILGLSLEIDGTQDTNDVIDTVSTLLERWPRSDAVQHCLFLLLAHVCFRQFRKDVLRKLLDAKELVGIDWHEKLLLVNGDSVKFSYKGIRDATIENSLYLAHANQTKFQTQSEVFQGLWSDQPMLLRSKKPLNRGSWDRIGFRTFYQKAKRVISKYPNAIASWDTMFNTEFFRYHTMIPLPDGNGTLLSTAKKTASQAGGQRIWLSLQDGVWIRKRVTTNTHPEYPITLTMDTPTLTLYLEDLIHRSAY